MRIAYTSDLHGEIGTLPDAWLYLRSMHSEEIPIIVLDAGDVSVGTPYFEHAGLGGMARVMRWLNYSVVALGNHDVEYHEDLRNFSDAQ